MSNPAPSPAGPSGKVAPASADKPWSTVRSGLGFAVFGLTLLIVPVAAALAGLLAALANANVSETAVELGRNLSWMAAAAGLTISLIGMGCGIVLRRDVPSQRVVREGLERPFAFGVGAVLMIAGTAALVRWFWVPDATTSVHVISGIGLVISAYLGLLCVWLLLGTMRRVARAAGDPRLVRRLKMLRGLVAGVGLFVTAVAVAEFFDAYTAVRTTLVVVLYVLTIAGGLLTALAVNAARRMLPLAAAHLAVDRLDK